MRLTEEEIKECLQLVSLYGIRPRTLVKQLIEDRKEDAIRIQKLEKDIKERIEWEKDRIY